MSAKKIIRLRLTDQDLNFLIEAAAPDVGDKSNRALHENFQKAKKPLNFIAEYYLGTKRHALFA